MDQTQTILKKYWGYDSFRPLQAEIIGEVIAGRDSVALLPTGGGKSLTYQIPALALDGVAIVVTPLIALMRDQVENLKRRGINAVAINSSMTFAQIDIALDNCAYGDVKLLYIAPERIDTLVFRSRLSKMNVSMVAVDEAHCISQWGYDFRPAYLRIASLRKTLPDVPFLAVTATATSAVLDDIKEYLELRDPKVFRASFARKNLSFVVRVAENKYEQILRIVSRVDGAGIVYCRTRAQTEQVADFLRARGFTADFYHAGLDFRLRSAKQSAWMEGRTRVIVATNAFGMGIDKSDVRFVVHFAPPDSVEAYYQEAGRAGRDGLRSWAVMLYNEQDRASVARRVEMEFPPVDEIKRVYEALFNYLRITIGGGKDEIYDFDLMKFSIHAKVFSLTAFNAIKILELSGYMTLSDEMEHPTRIMFRFSRDELYRFRVDNHAMDGFLKVLLRSYTGFFTDFVAIDEALLSHASGYTESKVIEMLLTLSRSKVIRYIPRRRSPLLVFHHERLPIGDLLIPRSVYTSRKEQTLLKADSIVEYARQNSVCRSLVLQNYFGEHSSSPCSVCDVCLSGKHQSADNYDIIGENQRIRAVILTLLRSDKEFNLRSLVATVDGSSVRVLSVIKDLISSQVVEQHTNGTITIKRVAIQ